MLVLSDSGNYCDVGFFRFGLGILMLFCVWDRNISMKQKYGILTGNDSNDGNSGGSSSKIHLF